MNRNYTEVEVRVERTGEMGGDRDNYDMGEEIDVEDVDTVRVIGVYIDSENMV